MSQKNSKGGKPQDAKSPANSGIRSTTTAAAAGSPGAAVSQKKPLQAQQQQQQQQLPQQKQTPKQQPQQPQKRQTQQQTQLPQHQKQQSTAATGSKTAPGKTAGELKSSISNKEPLDSKKPSALPSTPGAKGTKAKESLAATSTKLPESIPTDMSGEKVDSSIANNVASAREKNPENTQKDATQPGNPPASKLPSSDIARPEALHQASPRTTAEQIISIPLTTAEKDKEIEVQTSDKTENKNAESGIPPETMCPGMSVDDSAGLINESKIAKEVESSNVDPSAPGCSETPTSHGDGVTRSESRDTDTDAEVSGILKDARTEMEDLAAAEAAATERGVKTETEVIMAKTFTESILPGKEFIPIRDDMEESGSIAAENISSSGVLAASSEGDLDTSKALLQERMLSTALTQASDLRDDFRQLQSLLDDLNHYDLRARPTVSKPPAETCEIAAHKPVLRRRRPRRRPEEGPPTEDVQFESETTGKDESEKKLDSSEIRENKHDVSSDQTQESENTQKRENETNIPSEVSHNVSTISEKIKDERNLDALSTEIQQPGDLIQKEEQTLSNDVTKQSNKQHVETLQTALIEKEKRIQNISSSSSVNHACNNKVTTASDVPPDLKPATSESQSSPDDKIQPSLSHHHTSNGDTTTSTEKTADAKDTLSADKEDKQKNVSTISEEKVRGSTEHTEKQKT